MKAFVKFFSIFSLNFRKKFRPEGKSAPERLLFRKFLLFCRKPHIIRACPHSLPTRRSARRCSTASPKNRRRAFPTARSFTSAPREAIPSFYTATKTSGWALSCTAKKYTNFSQHSSGRTAIPSRWAISRITRRTPCSTRTFTVMSANTAKNTPNTTCTR